MSGSLAARRLAGILAILATLLALLITIPFAAAFFRAYGGSEPGLLRPWLASIVRSNPDLFDFGNRYLVYQLYGRIYTLVLPLSLLAMLAIKKQAGIESRLALWGWRIFLSGILLAALGIMGDYWADPNTFWVGIGFMIEMIGILLLWIGGILYGIQALSCRRLPRWVGWALIAIAPVGMLAMALLFHIPSAPLLGYVLFSFILGVYLLIGSRPSNTSISPTASPYSG